MRFLVLFILFSMSFVVYGQQKDVEIVVTVEDDDINKKLSGATVSVYADGQLITSSTSSGNGKVPTIYVPTGKYYQIFIRKNGYVSKMAELDARIDILEDAPDPLFLKLETALFKSVEGVDFAFLEKTPMAKFDFDSEYYYRYDKDYTAQMLKKIEELKRKIAEKRAEESKQEKENQKTEADFQAYVDAGDNAVRETKYQTAVQQYGLALELRKDNVEVKAKLAEAQRLLEEQQKNADRAKLYAQKMGEASKAYKGEQLQEAINLYTEASALMTEEQEPKDKINEIRLKIAAQKALDEKIKALVLAGDMAIAAEAFDEAITKYTEALGLRDDAEVQKKLNDAKKLKEAFEAALLADKQKIEQYNALMQSGEQLLGNAELESAKAKYVEASALMPDELLPKKKIEEIDALLADKAAKEGKLLAYNAKMEEAATAFEKEEWTEALSLYTQAGDILPLEQDPKQKITEINEILEKEKTIQAEYEKFVAEGDQFASTEAYEEAVSKYEKARQLNETDEITKKIKDALDAMQRLSEARTKAIRLAAQYKALIEKADGLRNSDKLEEAVVVYKEAQELKADEVYPAQVIEKINQILAERKAKAEAQAKAEAEYQAIIDAANKLFSATEWENSKVKFSEANRIRSADLYPIQKIDEINAILEELAKIEAQNKAYDDAMAEGQAKMDSKNYEAAIQQYTKAKEIKPMEAEPQAKIDAINKLLLDLKKEAEKEALYTAAMKLGNDLRDEKSYLKAKEAYENALSFKENDSKAIEEISKIDSILADLKAKAAAEERLIALIAEGDKLFSAQSYQDAKNKYIEANGLKTTDAVTEKIKLCDEKLKEFEDMAAKKTEFERLKKEADELFASEKWLASITKYEAAKALESTDYISSQIKAANDKLSLLAKDKETDEKVKSLVTEAKQFEAAKDFQKALNTYKAAYALRPSPEVNDAINNVEKSILAVKEEANKSQSYLAKIAEADALYKKNNFILAIDLYEAAKRIKTDESYPESQIKLCNAELAKLGEKENLEKYNEAVMQADQLFSQKKYDQAIIQYELAKQIVPSNSYPDKKIEEIRNIRKNLASAETDRLKKENEYKAIVNSGDDKFNTQNFEEAIGLYKNAQKIKAFDPYVVEKIKDAEAKLVAVNSAKAQAQKYQSYIDKADELMKQEDWKNAIAEYNNAILFDKANPYPKSQIKLAENAMLNDSKELSEGAYLALLKDAQSKMDAKQYDASLTLYKSAFRQRPTDNVPADKIRELNMLIANQNVSESSKNKYKTLVDKADNLFEKKAWKKARVYYVEAYNLTNDSYPDDQIKKIDAINNKFSSDQYSKMIGKADEYFREENYDKAKGLYQRAIKTFTSQNNSYPKAQIKKINSILNPPALLAGRDVKPVGEKVNLSESEIQKLFQEAEEANKNKDVSKVLKASETVDNIKQEWKIDEENATFQAVDSIEYQKALVAQKNAVAELKRQDVENDVNNVSQSVYEQQLYEKEYGESVSFRQMQVVENVDKSYNEAQKNGDRVREDFVPTIQNMNSEYKGEQIIQNGTQNNILFSQINQIETIKEEQYSAISKADIPRINAELDVANAEVNIVNQNNSNLWKQEDLVFQTQVAKESMDAEQAAAIKYSDIPRQDMEKMVNRTSDDYSDYQRQSMKQNEDFTNKTNEAVSDLKANMVEANKNADAGRENMELIDSRVSNTIKQTAISQSNLNQAQVELTNESITVLNEDQFQSHQNKTNKLYEDTETINENFDEVVNNQINDNAIAESYRHSATGLITSANHKMDQEALTADRASENSTDEIQINRDLMTSEQSEVEAKNQIKKNQTEDIITSLKDIDVKAITQAVKNELGNKYPEGVTEEVYQQKDADGYMVSYVIRRVVVKGGEGNVFEKSQMKHGISYTKNGQAISQYTWQDQTEDANLTYH